jgi:hypothetical protein
MSPLAGKTAATAPLIDAAELLTTCCAELLHTVLPDARAVDDLAIGLK